ncbi:MAG: DUF4445 domain-containing protein [Sedimentisphaerales bacterium]|nr:DUF4445 domain-containing protein [Sedimentisphaerales bacterium]
MEHFTISFKPDGKQISVHSGVTVMEAAGQTGIILNTFCGGKGTCRKCLVKIEPSGREVLACQYRIKSDLTITIPEQSRFFEQKILDRGIDTEIKETPAIYKRYLGITSEDKIFGVAVDIGTTTIVAKLVNMTNGQCLATEADINPQTKFGDDVISRIAYAHNKEKLSELNKVIIDCINVFTSKLCYKTNIDVNSIYEMCIVGNTTMNHIFLELPVTQLGQAPYKAYSLEAHDLTGEKLQIKMNPAGNIHTVENIAGFVGSDTTAVALAVDIESAEEMTLVVDIGTNGEIVLGTKDKLYAASCAAGPALEGARITCGSRATKGAIEAVVLNNDDDIDLDVIGNCPAQSICGSGLIDAVAILLKLGIIDTTGKFVDREVLEEKVSPAILSRISEQHGEPAFVLSAHNSAINVFLRQKDIRETQLAKAAIRAGIELLQKKIGLEDNEIKHILLAGAFGNYIRKESALRIGLLPNIPPERIIFVGNAASTGAVMNLVSQNYRDKSCKLAKKIEYIEIAHDPNFQDVFADSILF